MKLRVRMKKRKKENSDEARSMCVFVSIEEKQL
jgi:hypothetical protein